MKTEAYKQRKAVEENLKQYEDGGSSGIVLKDEAWPCCDAERLRRVGKPSYQRRSQ